MSHADLLFVNARCFTADPNNSRAEAVAARGNRIVFAGSNADAKTFRGARVIDAQGCTLMPGFIDSHFHLLWGSLELRDAQLGEVKTLDQLSAALRAFAADHPNREWLAGYGLPYKVRADGRMLTRHDLDAIIADRPLIVFAYDTHTAWANTEALRRANLLREGRTIGPNSEIVLGEDGLACGELREPGAFDPVMNLVPQPDDTEKRASLQKGLRLAAELGVTSVHNMNGDAGELALYAALDDLGEMTLRVVVPYRVEPDTPIEALKDAVTMREMVDDPRRGTQKHTGLGDDSWRLVDESFVRAGAAKFFMDGVIESYTGLLLDDYADRPGCRGDANFSAEHFNRMAIECDRLGLQILVHAVGDAAVRRTLDGFEAARTANGVRDSRHRVEHIELVHPDDLPRFQPLGVIASVQPLHAPPADGSDVWPARVGPARWDRSFAWRSLREAGARPAFGSDWPVVTQSALKGIHAAVNRKPWRAGGVDQSLTLEETLIAYTRDAAYAEFQERSKGQLRTGMLADLVLLSEDVFALPGERLAEVRAVMTVCDGRIVYE